MHRLYLVAIFLSALLLFQVQPLVSKAILPWFGGAPSVWTACMLFFQILLFLGYLYAHLISTYLRPVGLAVAHTCVIGSAMIMLPVLPDAAWKRSSGGVPTLQILALLSACVGLPFFLLASSAPLIQVWWQRTRGGQPYRLYALSNAGSLLALITFPVLFEPLLRTSTQGTVWSAAFVILGLLLIAGVWYSSRGTEDTVDPPARRHRSGSHGADTKTQANPDTDPEPHVQNLTLSIRAAWLFLPAMGVVLLLATTHHLCQDVAVVPFLWIAPLIVYLGTFILCFGRATGYRRSWYCGLVVLSTYGCAVLYFAHINPDFGISLVVNLTAMFACCMLCHGELVRLKPPAEHLTSFYLYISAGGALGGILVSLIAPMVFTDYYEYPLIWVVCWLVMFAVLFLSKSSKLRRGRPLWAWSLLIVCFFVCANLFSNGVVFRSRNALLRMRNFYGVLTVSETANQDGTDHRMTLSHGITVHGVQYLDKEKRYEPTTYYRRDSGVGYAINAKSKGPQRHFGVVGLGVGTIAAYARGGDRYRFYEIDPNVITLANDLFDYLEYAKKNAAEVKIIEGDARRSLEEEDDQEFDVLVLDAFSGDSIPVHLLTAEAFSEYLRHLKQDGILAMHVSNHYLDLVPLGAAISREHNLEWLRVLELRPNGSEYSQWILMARPGGLDAISTLENVVATSKVPQIEVWTDNYSNLFQLLR